MAKARRLQQRKALYGRLSVAAPARHPKNGF